MGLNVFFIVYRESFEAILILSIVWSLLAKSQVSKKIINFVLSIGTILGVLISTLTALLIYKFQSILDLFNNSILLISVFLITHMCLWMVKNAKNIKKDLGTSVEKSLEKFDFWGIIVLVCLSIAREGIETVIFLSGTMIEATRAQVFEYSTISFLGLVASLVTLYIFLKGFKFFKPKVFFMISSIFLFITAGSFVIKIVQSLVNSEYIPAIKDAVWDSSKLLDEASGIGNFVSMFTGYHSMPNLMTIITYLIYWLLVIVLYRRALKENTQTSAKA
jgi:high-affinity iron transporter